MNRLILFQKVIVLYELLAIVDGGDCNHLIDICYGQLRIAIAVVNLLCFKKVLICYVNDEICIIVLMQYCVLILHMFDSLFVILIAMSCYVIVHFTMTCHVMIMICQDMPYAMIDCCFMMLQVRQYTILH